MEQGETQHLQQILQVMNTEQIIISEAEFVAHEDKVLMDFAHLIRESGVSLYEIAKCCNLSWDTVKAAANGIPVKHATECRIRLYIERKLNGTKG